MYGYHRPKMRRVISLLRHIENNLDDLVALRDVQEILMRAILSAERNIRRWKEARSTLKARLAKPGLTR
jgi:hypothetical protein